MMAYSHAVIDMLIRETSHEGGTRGRVIQLVSMAGVLVLIVLVVMAILALTGQYEPSFTNPPS